MPWAAKNAAARVDEPGGGVALFIGVDLGVGEAGVVIDQRSG